MVATRQDLVRPERAPGPDQPSTMVDTCVLHVLVILCWMIWIVPWPVWHVAASVAGLAGMGFRWRRTVLANVHHVRSELPPPRLVAWHLGAQQIATHCKTVIGVLHAGVRLPNPADRLIVDGLEHLEPFLGGRGIVLVAPHAGPYPTLGLMASPWLRHRGFAGELVVVARLFRPFRSGALKDWFIDRFAQAGTTIVAADTSPRLLGHRLKKTLDSHGIVVLLIDEPTSTPSVPVPFFDSAIKLPLGPVRLAQATGSIIVPCKATYGPGRGVTLTIAEPIEPAGPPDLTLRRMAAALEQLVQTDLGQWSMLTSIWTEPPAPEPVGYSAADLHLHTTGSDGLCEIEDWARAAPQRLVDIIAITDHDHIASVQQWKERAHPAGVEVIPGVELTARGRIVHLGVLFPEQQPDTLPRPGTALVELVQWARTVPGSIVVLVHPLPLLWRWQLCKLARAGALPDAIETRFPLAAGRRRRLERAAANYGIAVVGGSDAHLSPDQLGRHMTMFPGSTVADLRIALRDKTTQAVSRPAGPRLPALVYVLQCLYSWLFPFRGNQTIARMRAALLLRARAQRHQDRTRQRPLVESGDDGGPWRDQHGER